MLNVYKLYMIVYVCNVYANVQGIHGVWPSPALRAVQGEAPLQQPCLPSGSNALRIRTVALQGICPKRCHKRHRGQDQQGVCYRLATRFAPGCYAFRYGVRFGSLLITLQKNAATCEVARMFRGFDAGLCIKLWFFSVFTPLIFTDIYPLLVFPTTVRLPQVPFEPGMKIERVRLEPRPCSRPPWRDDPIGQGSDSRRITRYYEFVRVSLCQNMPNVTVNCNMYNARGDMKSIAPHENGLKMQGMRF